MRYFYYGTEDEELPVDHKNELGGYERKIRERGRNHFEKRRFNNDLSGYAVNEASVDGLVIEEDTIYEIDQECMRCRDHKSRFQK